MRLARFLPIIIAAMPTTFVFAADLTVLATITPYKAAGPMAGLVVDSSGNLFGTATMGGEGTLGTVFQIDALTHQITTHVTFDGTNGTYPSGLTMDSGGNLYGTSYGGQYGRGMVFKVDAVSHELSTYYSFTTADGIRPMEGQDSLSIDSAGNLYGSYEGGGQYGHGAIYEIDATTKQLNVLYSFTDGTDGQRPHGSLCLDSNGNIYGATGGGVPYGFGTVFMITGDTHQFSTLATFVPTSGIGALPNGGLVQDAAGNLYGTTNEGGYFGDGTIFKIAKDTHELTTLYSLGGSSDGANPIAGLIMDAAGNLYGTTLFGGSANNGTAFRLSAGTNELTTLHSFTGGEDGASPYAGLTADAAGNLYGATNGGFASVYGTVFELTNTGFVVVPETNSLALVAVSAIGVLGLRSRMRRLSNRQA